VSSFQTVAKANEDLQRFQGIGYRGVIITVQVPGRGSWRRVILGPYPTLEEAQSVMQAVREDGLSPKAETMKLGP
jgi:cell division septation protein DedD